MKFLLLGNSCYKKSVLLVLPQIGKGAICAAQVVASLKNVRNRQREPISVQRGDRFPSRCHPAGYLPIAGKISSEELHSDALLHQTKHNIHYGTCSAYFGRAPSPDDPQPQFTPRRMAQTAFPSKLNRLQSYARVIHSREISTPHILAATPTEYGRERCQQQSLSSPATGRALIIQPGRAERAYTVFASATPLK